MARVRLVGVVGVVLLAGVLAAVGVGARGAAAHPLGNFTVNQYSRIEATTEGPRVVYVLDLAEIPAFQEIEERIDANGDGEITDGERDGYLAAKLAEITPRLKLTVDGERLSLQTIDAELTLTDARAGLKVVRLRAVLEPIAPVFLPASVVEVDFHNDYATDRLGWREVVVTHGAGVAVGGTDAALVDISDELRAYPEDLLSSPLDRTRATLTLTLAPGAPAAADFARLAGGGPAWTSDGVNVARPGGGSTGERFAALLDGKRLTPAGIALALALAAVWGAMHALSPGHGKTVVGAYLVGSRGTPRHAAFLGLTVTITHTAGVVALGLITLFASRYIVPETLFPWLSVSSGLVVVAMGLFTLRQRLRGQPAFAHHHHHHDHDHSHDHDHDHEHDHEHDHQHSALGTQHSALVHSHGGQAHSHLPPAEISWRALLALGVSGGLIPCPSALVVLLGSIALGRVGFGLALVVAFSLGLALTLTLLGLVFLYAGRYLERRLRPGGRLLPLLRYGPAVGSVALTIAGVAIVVRALEGTGLR